MLWVTDADNTLWDTDAIYRHAQLLLMSSVEAVVGLQVVDEDRLSYLRAVDQGIALQDHRGLKYPPSMLVEGLAKRLYGLSAEEAVKFALLGHTILSPSITKNLVEQFKVSLAVVPTLRQGVKSGFDLLREVGATVFVLTEGPKLRVEQTLYHHGIDIFVSSVLSAEKSPALFERVARLKPDLVSWAIGDQLDKDVLPAIDKGFHGILFPGGFIPTWTISQAESLRRYLVVDDYRSAVEMAVSNESSRNPIFSVPQKP